MARYETAIILSHTPFLPDGTLSEQTRERTDHGIALQKREETDFLTLSGGRAQPELPFTHASMMLKYVLAQGIVREEIATEEKSLDTVGQALFTKRDIVEPRNIGKLVVVSSAYHMPRVRAIFDTIYGTDFDIAYEGVPTADDNNPVIVDAEPRRIETFLRTFDGVPRGNTHAFVKRLYGAHPLYNKQ